MTDARARAKAPFHNINDLAQHASEPALPPFIESVQSAGRVQRAPPACGSSCPPPARTRPSRERVSGDDRRDVLASTRAALDYSSSACTACSVTGTGPGRLGQLGEGVGRHRIANRAPASRMAPYRPVMPNETRNYARCGGEEHHRRSGALRSRVIEKSTLLPDRHPQPGQDRNCGAPADVSLEDSPEPRTTIARSSALPARREILPSWDNATVFKRNLSLYRRQVCQLDGFRSVPATLERGGGRQASACRRRSCAPSTQLPAHAGSRPARC